MRWFLVLAVAAVFLANLPKAMADQDEVVLPASRWYGGPALLVDGAAVAGVLLAAKIGGGNSSTSGAVFWGAMATYVFGAPLVHLVHGNDTHAGESFLLRLGGLAAGVAVTYALASSSSSGCNAEGAQGCSAEFALVVAPIAAMLLDDLLLARDRPAPPSGPTLSSRVVVQPGLAMFGVGGTF